MHGNWGLKFKKKKKENLPLNEANDEEFALVEGRRRAFGRTDCVVAPENNPVRNYSTIVVE